MYLANHPINRLLNDAHFWFELAILMPWMKENAGTNQWLKNQAINLKVTGNIDMSKASQHELGAIEFLKEPGKLFLVTNTVTDKLNLLRPKYTDRDREHMDWTVFRGIDLSTSTFILPNNEVMRIREFPSIIFIMVISFSQMNIDANKAHMDAHFVYIDKKDYVPGSHLHTHQYLKIRSEYIYKLMSFIYLSETEEETLKPGQSKGTKKTGKTINTIGHDITIINSKWNITSIRNQSFGVSGHFAIRWCGAGRTEAKVVWIDPFTKNGYVRKAKNQSL